MGGVFKLQCREVALEELLLLLAAALLEQLEGALARLVALAGQELQGLLAGHHLLTAHNAAVLVLHQILLSQATGGVLGSAVEYLGLGANCDHLSHLILRAAIFNRVTE
jgi:hypothetical protein